MGKYLWFLLSVLFLAIAAPAGAQTISNIDIQLGTWNGSSFGSHAPYWEWNNLPNNNPVNWAVGITNTAALGDPLLNPTGSPDNVALGNYYLYMAAYPDDAGDNAIQVILDLSNSTSETEVFVPLLGGSAETNGAYQLVQGSGFGLNLVSGPQSTYELVGQVQTYHSDGSQNWILDLNATPEPSSMLLFGTGLLGVAFVMRKRLFV